MHGQTNAVIGFKGLSQNHQELQMHRMAIDNSGICFPTVHIHTDYIS